MKKTLFQYCFLLIACVSSHIAIAQNADNPLAITAGFGVKDYAGELGAQVLRFKGRELQPNAYLGASLYLSPSFDVMFGGSFGKYGFLKNGSENFDGTTFDVSAVFKYKILKENAVIAPYLLAGVGTWYYKGKSNNTTEYNTITLNLPLGLGFRIRTNQDLSFYVQSTYNYQIVEDKYDGNDRFNDWKDAFVFTSIGMNVNIGKAKDTDGDGVADRKDTCPDTPADVKVDEKGCPIDTDKDGIADHLDTCPAEAGEANTQGCPDADKDGIADKDDACPQEAGTTAMKGCADTDNDGIANKDDKCPTVAGKSQFAGCPDTDNDGIQDSDDKCPTVAGLTSLQGCPDADGDGVTDADDKCPTVSGPASNNGCPVIKQEDVKRLEAIAKRINFATGSDVLTQASLADLNQLADILKREALYKVEIDGHTDNVGNAAANKTLSQKRANAVKAYLVKKGVAADRLTAIGYGAEKPIADNKTPQGRTQNRRVELKLQ
jgi:outer membrane protein OmpA-like peptidoglycan-associated protein